MELDSSADGLRTNIIHHQHHQHDDHEKYEDQHKQHHFHVLAVDDSLIDRKLLERLLTVSSYQVTCVDSGDKALEYLGLLGMEEKEYESSSKQSPQQEVSKINMIMTDYSMPGITGYDLLKRIKDSSWKNIPVVVMSSENVPSRINMCLEGGAEEFLLKPVKPSDLEKLHTHLLKLNDHDDDDQQLHYSNISKDNINSNDIVKLSHEEDNAIAITINKEIISVVCNSEDKESDMSTSSCSSGITNTTNKRKTISSTTSLPSTTNISSDVSDRRARVQELSVNS